MSTLQILINLGAYACFTLGTLLVWPSRRNIVAWLAVPFFVVAYVVPLSVVDYAAQATPDTISALTGLNLVAMLATVVGLVFGSAFGNAPRRRHVMVSTAKGSSPDDVGFRSDRVVRATTLGCAVMTLCFAWMGVLPILADEPLLAKFFRGPYKERYDQVAVFYRFSQSLLATALPAALVLLLSRRHARTLLPCVAWALALFAVSLNRGTVVAGLILMIAVACSRSRARLFWLTLISTAVYALGSSIYALIGIFAIDDFDPWLEIARGAPDVADHLLFLDAFQERTPWTYGLTFVGGLIPGNFAFNPSVFTLAVVNGTGDVSDIASGGLRLPPSLAGYAAFGWFGALAIPLVSGFVNGALTQSLRRMQHGTIARQVSAILWFQIVAQFFINFYAMSYPNVIAIIVLALITARSGWPKFCLFRRRSSSRSTTPPAGGPILEA